MDLSWDQWLFVLWYICDENPTCRKSEPVRRYHLDHNAYLQFKPAMPGPAGRMLLIDCSIPWIESPITSGVIVYPGTEIRNVLKIIKVTLGSIPL